MAGKVWWQPDHFKAKLPALQGRMAVMAAIRRFFAERDFWEVETPALQISPGLEPHLKAFATRLEDGYGRDPATLYLHTSPEFAMKKLLVAGAERIFQLAKVYRNGERSPTHHPEFTMLEWYRAGASYTELMDDCEALLRTCLTAAGGSLFRRGERVCDPFQPWLRLSVQQAFLDYTGIDLLATAPDPLAPDIALLAAEAQRIGIRPGDHDNWDDIFFRILLEHIEPKLGDGVPCILYDYPLSMAALSRPSAADPRVAERFEMYVCGVELCNAFGELTDPAIQRARFQADMDLKEKLYGERYPIDEDFLAALDHGMPDSAGIALGVDRLVMLATGAEDLEGVLWAPVADVAGKG